MNFAATMPSPVLLPPPSAAQQIFTPPVLVGAGIGYLMRGLVGAVVGGVLVGYLVKKWQA